MSGYTLKTVQQFTKEPLQEKSKSMAYIFGHYMSTRNSLLWCGTEAIWKGQPVFARNVDIALSRDATMRFQSFPAGTHKLSLCASILDRLWISSIIFIVPSPTDFGEIQQKVKKVQAAPASFHIGPHYLTGESREDYDDKRNDYNLGRLGTFICANYSSSTLVKSPLITKESVQSSLDYD